MTLDKMLQETAVYTGESIGDAPYSGSALAITNIFKSAINYAYKRIAREKWMPFYSEDVELDANLQFAVASLTKKFNGIKKIEDSDGDEIIWEMATDGTIECPYEEAEDDVTVTYFYIPDDLSSANDEPVIPNAQADHKLLCYYAAFQYLVTEEEPDEQVNRWLGLWNEGYFEITQNTGEMHQTKEYW